MKHLLSENMILEIMRIQSFRIFDICVKVGSRIHILSTSYRFSTVWGLHFGSLGPTFWGLFFRSRKTPGSFLQLAPGWRPSSTPPGEGGNHRRFSPLTLPISKKASYNIWPSVEHRKHNFFMTFGLHFGTFFS